MLRKRIREGISECCYDLRFMDRVPRTQTKKKPRNTTPVAGIALRGIRSIVLNIINQTQDKASACFSHVCVLA